MVCGTYAPKYSAYAYIKPYWIYWCSLVYQKLQRKSLKNVEKIIRKIKRSVGQTKHDLVRKCNSDLLIDFISSVLDVTITNRKKKQRLPEMSDRRFYIF